MLSLLVAAAGACVEQEADELNSEAPLNADEQALLDWEKTRAERQAALDAYMAANQDKLRAFLYTPLGNLGIPTSLVGVLPAVFPDIWGPPSERMAAQGFGPDPFNSQNPLPLGLGRTQNGGVDFTNLTCAGCHVGRVIGPDNKVMHLIGAPNTQFNQFRASLEDSVRDPRWDAVFGTNPGLQAFKQKVLQRRQLIDATLGSWTYNRARFPNAPDLNDHAKPGFLDAIGVGLVILTVPDIFDPSKAASVVQQLMPPAPAQIDIMSIWRQRARTSAQWDGAIVNPTYRNIAASVGVIGQPSAVDSHNAAVTADFALDLPSAPYPFQVDVKRARIGAGLYRAHCASCHTDNNDRIFAPEYVGTDPNRSQTITSTARERFIPVLRSACVDSNVCDVPDEQILRDQTAPGSRGYMAPPLDGIWARAPYLHNGSVPTLYHLLVPSSRPAQFVRGSIRYDQAKVGFAWDDTAKADKYSAVFDTTQAGASNAGHSSLEFTGMNWEKNPELLLNLLEYLKTL